MKSRVLVAAVAALTILFPACDDDGTGPGGDELTQNEVEALVAELSAALSAVAPSPASAPAADGFSAVPIDVTVPIAETFQCVEGTMSFLGSAVGTIDSETGGYDLTLDFIWDMQGCVLQSPTSETVFTVNGAPDIDYVVDVTYDPETFTFTTDGAQDGAIRIQTSDGRDATCAFDVDFTTSTNLQTSQFTQTATGTICGLDVNAISTFTGVTGT